MSDKVEPPTELPQEEPEKAEPAPAGSGAAAARELASHKTAEVEPPSYELIQALQEWFDAVDVNNDDGISYPEFLRTERFLGKLSGELADAAIERDFSKLDENKDNVLTWPEFCEGKVALLAPFTDQAKVDWVRTVTETLLSNRHKLQPGLLSALTVEMVLRTLRDEYGSLEEAFELLDADRSGSLCCRELRFCLERATGKDIPLGVVRGVLRALDLSKDGTLSLEELVQKQKKWRPPKPAAPPKGPDAPPEVEKKDLATACIDVRKIVTGSTLESRKVFLNNELNRLKSKKGNTNEKGDWVAPKAKKKYDKYATELKEVEDILGTYAESATFLAKDKQALVYKSMNLSSDNLYSRDQITFFEFDTMLTSALGKGGSKEELLGGHTVMEVFRAIASVGPAVGHGRTMEISFKDWLGTEGESLKQWAGELDSSCTWSAEEAGKKADERQKKAEEKQLNAQEAHKAFVWCTFLKEEADRAEKEAEAALKQAHRPADADKKSGPRSDEVRKSMDAYAETYTMACCEAHWKSKVAQPGCSGTPWINMKPAEYEKGKSGQRKEDKGKLCIKVKKAEWEEAFEAWYGALPDGEKNQIREDADAELKAQREAQKEAASGAEAVHGEKHVTWNHPLHDHRLQYSVQVGLENALLTEQWKLENPHWSKGSLLLSKKDADERDAWISGLAPERREEIVTMRSKKQKQEEKKEVDEDEKKRLCASEYREVMAAQGVAWPAKCDENGRANITKEEWDAFDEWYQQQEVGQKRIAEKQKRKTTMWNRQFVDVVKMRTVEYAWRQDNPHWVDLPKYPDAKEGETWREKFKAYYAKLSKEEIDEITKLTDLDAHFMQETKDSCYLWEYWVRNVGVLGEGLGDASTSKTFDTDWLEKRSELAEPFNAWRAGLSESRSLEIVHAELKKTNKKSLWNPLGQAIEERRAIEKYYKKMRPECVNMTPSDYRADITQFWEGITEGDRQAIFRAYGESHLRATMKQVNDS
jgi:Ca2+-binding EF-hand superfamily protein